MRSFFPESEDYLPPPQARFVKPLHSGLGDSARRCLQKISLRGRVGMTLITAAIVIGFAVASSAMAASNHPNQPMAVPRAVANAACAAVNCNPWGYNFNKGKKIAHPSTAFCHYFTCIGNFAKGKGYVEECKDGKYSKSGGRSGSCADHRGNWRPLLGP